jgi:hypothetical protein
MKNREFISAANLPVTEAEDVSVLCLENGALKQKPANGLGGNSGGGGFDLIMASIWRNDINNRVPSIVNGDYNAIYKKLSNNQICLAAFIMGSADDENVSSIQVDNERGLELFDYIKINDLSWGVGTSEDIQMWSGRHGSLYLLHPDNTISQYNFD